MTNICYRTIDRTMNIEELKKRAATGDAELWGGLILIAIGIKVLIEHMSA